MTGSTPLDYALQPYQGTDVLAIVLAIAALSCLTIRWRDNEPGMGWFALSMGALALWVAANAAHLPSGPALNPSPWYFVMCLAMGAMGPGLVAYLDLPAARRRTAMLPIVAPALAFAAAVAWVLASGATVPRVWVHALTAASFSAMAVLVLRAARREPSAGYAFLGAALLTVPALAVLLVVTGADPVAIRYWAVLPVVLVGLSLPTVSVLRRRHALQDEVARRAAAERTLAAMNSSLEAQVARRTADLQDMVTGLESFNRNVSHDLRGPLGGIAGLARLAERKLMQGDLAMVTKALPLIADQADASSQLVSSLLELARVDQVEVQRQRVDPAAIAREVVAQLALSPQASALPEVLVHALPALHTDPALLRVVLSNLIGNAVKFARNGEQGRVDVGSCAQANGVCFYVQDNGIGFAADAAATLFKPFTRLHGPAYAGHGIGLSIVHRAVDRLGGRVWAESAPGQGACFKVVLPASA